MISSLVQENISPWGSEQKMDRTPDRIGLRIGSDLKIIFTCTALGNVLLHNCMRVQFQNQD